MYDRIIVNLWQVLTSENFKAAALKVKTESLIHKIILERTLRMYDEEMMITKTAREWLFAGYADPLVTMSNLMSVFTKVDVPFDRVGWMYMVSIFNIDNMEFYVGSPDIYLFYFDFS